MKYYKLFLVLIYNKLFSENKKNNERTSIASHHEIETFVKLNIEGTLNLNSEKIPFAPYLKIILESNSKNLWVSSGMFK